MYWLQLRLTISHHLHLRYLVVAGLDRLPSLERRRLWLLLLWLEGISRLLELLLLRLIWLLLGLILLLLGSKIKSWRLRLLLLTKAWIKCSPRIAPRVRVAMGSEVDLTYRWVHSIYSIIDCWWPIRWSEVGDGTLLESRVQSGSWWLLLILSNKIIVVRWTQRVIIAHVVSTTETRRLIHEWMVVSTCRLRSLLCG